MAPCKKKKWMDEYQQLSCAPFYHITAGNLVGLSVGGVIAMESGMKTVETRLEGSGSELLYLMNRYS
jgi:hypothetical protein